MAAGVFKVREILPSGLTGVVFYWNSSEVAPFSTVEESVRGGARAAPLGDWNQGGSMRSIPTHYTGNPVPSEQVLGAMESPQDFNGRWDDRYNYKGYAQDTWEEFKALCMRGNLVEISFQSKGYVGLLKNWNFAERRVWDIRYSFDLSIHGSIEDVEADNFNLDEFIEKSPIDHRDDVDDVVEALIFGNGKVPSSHLSGAIGDEASQGVANISVELDSLDDILDQSDIASSPFNPLSPFRQLRSGFDAIVSAAASVNQLLLQTKSSTELAVVTGKSVLDYEEWSRSLRFNSRLLMGRSLSASNDMDARDNPEIERLYRAHEGQSLMAISREVYGTPHQWAAIYEANNLTSEVLTEPELLIIPNLGSA